MTSTLLGVSAGDDKFKVWGKAFLLGKDVVLVIGGGDTPHIGCVALALPRKSRKGKSAVRTTSSVLNLLGHKDEEIVRVVAERVCVSINKPVVCVGGIHVENADSSDIELIVENGMKVAERLAEELKNLFEGE